jgi:hypothetical protein
MTPCPAPKAGPLEGLLPDQFSLSVHGCFALHLQHALGDLAPELYPIECGPRCPSDNLPPPGQNTAQNVSSSRLNKSESLTHDVAYDASHLYSASFASDSDFYSLTRKTSRSDAPWLFLLIRSDQWMPSRPPHPEPVHPDHWQVQPPATVACTNARTATACSWNSKYPFPFRQSFGTPTIHPSLLDLKMPPSLDPQRAAA